MSVITRFAPSPTGALHIGGVRTALFCYLYARAHGGQFRLRLEDTDAQRSTREAADDILAGLQWLNLTADGEVVYQSRRLARYHEVLQQLLARKRAYHCYCSADRIKTLRAEQLARGDKPRYDRRCLHRTTPPPHAQQSVVRFLHNDEGEAAFTDLVHGKLRFSNKELDDLVLVRTDGTPTYNFAVVVDDMDMDVSHVLRGDDHINNTPRQLNILQALDASPPHYAHLPMINGADGQSLSKRHGALSVLEYRRGGYLPEAVLNYLLRLGWSHGDRELFTVDEMVQCFAAGMLNKSAATFDTEKLRWYNQQYIKEQSAESLLPAYLACLREQGITDDDILSQARQAIDAYRERAATLEEMAQNTLWCYRELAGYDEAAAAKFLRPDIATALASLRVALNDVAEWQPSTIHEALTAVVAKHDIKFGRLAQAVRIALTGSTASPPIDTTIELCGRTRTDQRLADALRYIQTP